jgi:hypothetical protein
LSLPLDTECSKTSCFRTTPGKEAIRPFQEVIQTLFKRWLNCGKLNARLISRRQFMFNFNSFRFGCFFIVMLLIFISLTSKNLQEKAIELVNYHHLIKSHTVQIYCFHPQTTSRCPYCAFGPDIRDRQIESLTV